jgi:hypothetical protein
LYYIHLFLPAFRRTPLRFPNASCTELLCGFPSRFILYLTLICCWKHSSDIWVCSDTVLDTVSDSIQLTSQWYKCFNLMSSNTISETDVFKITFRKRLWNCDLDRNVSRQLFWTSWTFQTWISSALEWPSVERLVSHLVKATDLLFTLQSFRFQSSAGAVGVLRRTELRRNVNLR